MNALRDKVQHQYGKLLANYNRDLAKKDALEVIVTKYSGVILLAATDLQDRVWHLCERQAKAQNPVLKMKNIDEIAYPMWPMTKKHYLHSTIYLFAKYFCWVEILRRDIQFLNFGDDKKTNDFNYFLKKIERCLAETGLKNFLNPGTNISSDRPIFQLMQTEIGESLIVEEGALKQCMMYWNYIETIDDFLNKSSAYKALEALLEGAMGDYKTKFHLTRLRLLNNALVELINFLNDHNRLLIVDEVKELACPGFDLKAYQEKWSGIYLSNVQQPEEAS